MRLLVASPGLLLVGLVVCSCGGGNAAARPDCPAGQTSLDGTCVSQQIADYVGCIRATGATVASDSAKSLSAAAGVAGVTGSTQAEVKDKLEKSYAKVSDENAQTIIRNCDNKTAASSPSGGGGSSRASAASVGCADGQREGFLPASTFPNIAGCSGGWTIPGVRPVPAPSCQLRGGNGGPNTNGAGCSAADLCEAGWHVCRDASDVAGHSPAGCFGAVPASTSEKLFFASAQGGIGSCGCGGDGANDLFGCGNLGFEPSSFCSSRGVAPAPGAVSCGTLWFSADLCTGLGLPWSCGSDGTNEGRNVTKPGSAAGGVACCRD